MTKYLTLSLVLIILSACGKEPLTAQQHLLDLQTHCAVQINEIIGVYGMPNNQQVYATDQLVFQYKDAVAVFTDEPGKECTRNVYGVSS